MYQLCKAVLGQPITVTGWKTGEDWVISVFGGSRPHIGSVTTAYWAEGHLEVKTILLPAHRDNVVGERFAEAVAEQTGKTVCVTCGIHYENPSKEDLAAIVSACEELLEEWKTLILCVTLK